MNKKLLNDILELFNDLEEMEFYDPDLKSRIEAELAKPDPEPIAWLYDFDDGEKSYLKNWITQSKKHIEKLINEGISINVRPLYAEPPAHQELQLQMLSDDEVWKIQTYYGTHPYIDFDYLVKVVSKESIKAFCEKNGLKL